MAMSPKEFYGLKRGDGVIVRFGSHATQLARVHHWTRDGNLYVCKWRARGTKWTQPVRVVFGEVLHPAFREWRDWSVQIPPHYWALKRGQATVFLWVDMPAESLLADVGGDNGKS